MRLRRRPQGRIPVRLVPTRWEVVLYSPDVQLGMVSERIVEVIRWLADAKPGPQDRVQLIRNHRLLFDGKWEAFTSDMDNDPTLW